MGMFMGLLGIGNILTSLVGQVTQLVVQHRMMQHMQDMARQMAGDIQQNKPCAMFNDICNHHCSFGAKGEIGV